MAAVAIWKHWRRELLYSCKCFRILKFGPFTEEVMCFSCFAPVCYTASLDRELSVWKCCDAYLQLKKGL